MRGALALLAVHAPAAAFVVSQAGTSAADHLASGLVPAALCGALALAYPRLRAWRQAALTAALGALALLGAVGVSARHVAIDRLAAVDVTALVAQGGEERKPAYFAAARQPKRLWKVPGAGHTAGLTARPREYERRVVGFFDRYLAAG